MPIKRLTILLFVAGLGMMIGCHKSSNNPAASNGYNYPVMGMAYIKTGYSDTTSMPLRNKPVFIDTTFGTDTASHSFSVVTGADGTFIFYLSDTTRNYRLYTDCYDTVSSTFIPLYYGAVVVTHPYHADTVYALTATIDTLYGNGMIITTVDQNRQILPRVNVVLYSSASVAGKDTALSSPQAFRRPVTDSLGKAFVAGVPFSSLYQSAKIMIGARDSIMVFDSAITVPRTGVFRDTVILH